MKTFNGAENPGVWDSEPNEETWTDGATGFRCHMQRNHGGCLCGYVAFPLTEAIQPFDANDLDVHGGITYERDHWPLKHEPLENCTVYGFDCSHLYDYQPKLHTPGSRYNDFGDYTTYRDWGYVKGQVEYLARQLNEHRFSATEGGTR